MAGHPRAEKNKSGPNVLRGMLKLLNRRRDQRDSLVGPASKRVRGAEGCGDERYSDGDLPRSAEFETSREDKHRGREISSTKVGAAEIKQGEVQGEGRFVRLGKLHRRLGVPEGLVEPAELGEHVGEVCPRASCRPRRLLRSPVAQVAR